MVFSLGTEGIPPARRYIETQEEHHRAVSFQDEYRELLQGHGLEWDERYVWD
ncbi:transposase [Fimbriimonas ginsengisoli Gsoil 348]|uniref:Transposase n=1 Tax=Fimbriimonas ginsengisoli Gsoil 348 TaxID=661478 RepID=A0A068NND9_FIMGI|nr:transposase [Fimbriimonas ginsengisoli Gsoil 348]